MDFALEETPQAVKDLAADVLRREGERTGSRDTEAGGYDEAVWKAMGDSGLLSLAVPESLGGAGLGPMETAAVLCEVGRHAMSVPALTTLAFGVLPLSRLGTERQRADLLQGLDAGRVFTAALNEPSAPMPARPRTTARRHGDDIVVSGTKTGVLHGGSAHRILTSVTLDGDAGVVLVDPGAEGVTLFPSPTSSGACGATMRLDDVRISPRDLLGETVGRETLDEVYQCAIAGICALADGALAGALSLTSEHLRTRTQFGKPLATFQAVAQQIADVYVVARTMELATRTACWRLASGRDAAEDLAVAALWLVEELPPVLQVCHHLHGGLGVDVTYPMHRHYSMIKDLVLLAGGAEHQVEQLAGQLS